MKFRCDSCGEEHDLAEISFGIDRPVQWDQLSESDRARSVLGGEQCEINTDEGTNYFVRGCLEIPVKATDRAFTWQVWCSLSERSYLEVSDHWEDVLRTQLGPYFGWLCSRIPAYPDTLYLKSMVHQREVGVRPSVELEPTDHPLSVDQRNGIEPERLQQMVMALLH